MESVGQGHGHCVSNFNFKFLVLLGVYSKAEVNMNYELSIPLNGNPRRTAVLSGLTQAGVLIYRGRYIGSHTYIQHLPLIPILRDKASTLSQTASNVSILFLRFRI